MTRHAWTLTTAVPPAAWAALRVDARTLVAVARSRGITVAGPDGTGEPILDSERIALAVRSEDTAPFSAPFVFSRTLLSGELNTVDAVRYDAIVLAALGRAARHFGAVLTVTTDADQRTAAHASRLAELVFGKDDRRIAGVAEPDPRGEVEQLTAGFLDELDGATLPPTTVIGYLNGLIPLLTAERDGRVAAEPVAPVA